MEWLNLKVSPYPHGVILNGLQAEKDLREGVKERHTLCPCVAAGARRILRG